MEGHVCNSPIVAESYLFGALLLFTLQTTIKTIGPAYAQLSLRTSLLNWEGTYLTYLTPIGHLRTSVITHVYGKRKGLITYLIGKLFLYADANIVSFF